MPYSWGYFFAARLFSDLEFISRFSRPRKFGNSRYFLLCPFEVFLDFLRGLDSIREARLHLSEFGRSECLQFHQLLGFVVQFCRSFDC